MGHVAVREHTVQQQHHVAGHSLSNSIPLYQRSLEYKDVVTESHILTTNIFVAMDNFMRRIQGKLAVDQVSCTFLEINYKHSKLFDQCTRILANLSHVH